IRVSRALPNRAMARPYAFMDSTEPTAGASRAKPKAADDRCRSCLISGMRGTHEPNSIPFAANVTATAARARCRLRAGAAMVTPLLFLMPQAPGERLSLSGIHRAWPSHPSRYADALRSPGVSAYQGEACGNGIGDRRGRGP